MPAFRSKTFIHASFWTAALAVGLLGVGFEHLISLAQDLHHKIFKLEPTVSALVSVGLFMAAVALVVLVAPQARGSGIPQVIRAMMLGLGSHQTAMKSGLISIRVAVVKAIGTTMAIAAGASVGREGPTVQISTAIFAWVGSRTKKIFPYADFHSYLVAGAATGVAAAFNTPLAGITFALEEMAEGSFAQIKRTVMLSVIIGGIAAQTLTGNYLYFGNPVVPTPGIGVIVPAIAIGIACGLLGSVFARALAYPVFGPLKFTWWQKALVCALVVTSINIVTRGQTAGTGYEITRNFMDSSSAQFDPLFGFMKLISTVFSFLSGMAGGIFSPSLSIGAGLGATFGEWLDRITLITTNIDPKTCALLGMVAFFTGAVQAPLTAVIIVMEMTDIHQLIIPLMISAFVAQGVARVVMPVSLYRFLAHHHPPS